MTLKDLTAEAVIAAIEEFDQLGADAFRAKYRFGPATDYLLERDGKSYDSKAIAGAAHGYLSGKEPLRPEDFSGGDATVGRQLRALGFRIPPRRSPPWARDEVILACDLVAANNWAYLTAEDPRVVELSAILQRSQLHPPEVRSEKFRNPNGVARKTVDIATHHPEYEGAPTKGGEIDRVVLNQFLSDPEYMHELATQIRHTLTTAVEEGIPLAPVDEEDEGAMEGRLLQRTHFHRERDKKLRDRKIRSFLKGHKAVYCEIREFNFEEAYGNRGRNFIEVHHVLPLHASGPTTTKLGDLVLVCSNCHRMIHRSTPWLTPDDVRRLLLEQSSTNNQL
ncbi:HNH endonuclease [Dietzia sp. SYD-A1]|uniref:HNH endonuclease n=1 Tax=Dietzia sp. SYD-A1 TaxID=2780141 RepID=UPI001890F047|nr:HNH endonuclease [Dietzia sp. SYD-A1]